MKNLRYEGIDLMQMINKVNFNSQNYVLNEEDFHVGLLGCLICKEIFKTFSALFTHMKISHDESYEFFHAKIINPETKMNEAHIIVFQKSIVNAYNDDENNETYCYNRNKDKNKEKMTILNLLKRYDINIENDVFGPKYTCKSVPKSIKKYEESNEDRVYFHSVTGGILHNDSEDSDYEIIAEDKLFIENKQIDSYTDICDSDKLFFKKWNRFISQIRNVSFSSMPKILYDFVLKHGKELIDEKLKENFLLHMICLYEHQQINNETFCNVMKLLDSHSILPPKN